jgi:hypothetical protein
MRPQTMGLSLPPDLTERAGEDQARRASLPRRGRVLVSAVVALLGGCEVPKEVNPVEIYREVAGINDQRRLPPPGLDLPYRSLGSVPPRPERPPAEAREAISAALAADRTASRDPLAVRGVGEAGPGAEGPSPGEPPLPAAPPPRPSLAVAPVVPWANPPAPPRGGAGRGAPPAAMPSRPAPVPHGAPGAPATPPPTRPEPTRAAPPAPEMPAAPPPPPPAEFLSPGPAPPPPPSPDLLAPGAPALR